MFLPASQLDVTRKPPETPHRQEVHVTLSESVYGGVFNEGEEVNIVSKDGRRTTGKVKWTSPSTAAWKLNQVTKEIEVRMLLYLFPFEMCLRKITLHVSV